MDEPDEDEDTQNSLQWPYEMAGLICDALPIEALSSGDRDAGEQQNGKREHCLPPRKGDVWMQIVVDLIDKDVHGHNAVSWPE